MSNIKSEALFQVCSKRKIFLKVSSELAGKELCARFHFIMKVQAECIKPNLYVYIVPGTGIFQWSLRKFLEHLSENQQFCRISATAAPLKCYL